MATDSVWNQQYLLFGQTLGVSALIAALPIFALLLLLGVLRKPAWIAGLTGLGVTFWLALGAYHMPVLPAVSAALYGAAFGLFPISWIVYWAIALFRVSVDTGKFEIIKASVGRLTADPRLQAILIGFAFGAFVEGAAGFGTPVAVAAAMLTGLGFSPFNAAAICLLANTSPVAFGSIGIPVITLAGITGLPLERLSADVGRLCAPISLIIPAYLIFAMGGRKALKGVFPAVVAAGATFAAVQFTVSNFIGPQLTDILSSLAAMGAVILLLKFWCPAAAPNAILRAAILGPSSPAQQTNATPRQYSRAEVFNAWLPYVFLVLFVLLWGFRPWQAVLNSVSFTIHWPGLHNIVQRMPPVIPHPAPYAAVFNLNWLAASGTSCMFATILSALVLKMPVSAFFRLLISVVRQLILPTVTVTSVLAMAFLMNYCGATGTLGLAFSATGKLFPFFSALLGWVGVFLTGSDTSSNALFGSLQVVTAGRLGLSPVLMAATNSSGGVLGKMISLQTIAVAAAATEMSVPDQARLFRFTLKHSILLAAVVGCLAMLYTYVLRFP
jgi:L-lactate transport